MLLKDLRDHAIAKSLFRPGTLQQAMDRLGFVQADPIRSPARAQDLILRHRVKDYRVGDLDRQYHDLQLEEDRLYAHGFMPQSTWRLLHPKTGQRLTAKEKKVLDVAVDRGRIHPRDLETHFGRKSERNYWGGSSEATTMILQRLHFHGFVRVAGRENGIRVYAPITQRPAELDRTVRFRQLVLTVAAILAPLSEKSLRTALVLMASGAPGLKVARSFVGKLIESGDLASAVVDGVRYVWPRGPLLRSKPGDTVRFLTPFDPLVWDRQRFEHFWGWPYRFEAYVPSAKRQLGYYAMPMLWRKDVIGWVNATTRSGKLIVEPGFKKSKPTDAGFRVEFEKEVARLDAFLRKREERE